jgi:ADP-heptose:LPS heptosyltransferase
MRILVIKFSALGDFIQASAAFDQIRKARPDARLTLLTTPPYEELGRAGGWFEEIWSDGRPAGLAAWLSLIARIRAARFDLVVDLQANDRTNWIFQALRPASPAWSGAAWGARFRRTTSERMRLHTLDRQMDQLAQAGLWPDPPASAPAPSVAWLLGDSPPEQRQPLAVLVPGAAPSRPAKRWPAEAYGALAARLIARGLEVAVIGGGQERELAGIIRAAAPAAQDLTGRTGYADIARLGARAALAVGNDTGPMHILAAAGAPALVLFSADSDPALCAPRGEVRVLQSCHLRDLSVESVWEAALASLEGRPHIVL